MRTLSLEQARAIWWHRAGLNRPGKTDLGGIPHQHGWLRTLGGVEPYLALRARFPEVDRAQVAHFVQSGDWRIVPAARGCMYLVPAEDASPALAIAQDTWQKSAQRDFKKLDYAWSDLEKLADQIMTVLNQGAMSTDQIRAALPEVPSFGEAGKKIGVSSPMPAALRLLEFQGRIWRQPLEYRIDWERYTWVPAAHSSKIQAPDPGSLVKRFLEFAAPVTMPMIQTWTGLGAKVCQSAVQQLDAEAVHVADLPGTWFDFPLDHPPEPGPEDPVFLPTEDLFTVAHDGPGLLVDPAFHAVEVPEWGRKQMTTLGSAKHLAFRPIFVQGELVGFWEFEPELQQVVTATWSKTLSPQLLEEQSQALAQFLMEMGTAKSFSLDTDAKLKERAHQIRLLAESL